MQRCDQDCVLVLLSTFNGELYIEEQIESIRKQEDVCTHLLVRDDGSKDGTLRKVRDLIDLKKDLLLYGENLGVNASYLLLSKSAIKYNFNYICTSDQDDVWFANKLFTGREFLKSNKEFQMYSSQRAFLKKSGSSFDRHHREGLALFEWFLFENPSFGNTQFFTFQLLENYINFMSLNAQFTEVPFDLNLARFAAIDAKLYIDSKVLLNYRIHDRNTVGLGHRSLCQYVNLTNLSMMNTVKYLSTIIEMIHAFERMDANSRSLSPLVHALVINDSQNFRRFAMNSDLRIRKFEDYMLKLIIWMGYVPRNMLLM